MVYEIYIILLTCKSRPLPSVRHIHSLPKVFWRNQPASDLVLLLSDISDVHKRFKPGIPDFFKWILSEIIFVGFYLLLFTRFFFFFFFNWYFIVYRYIIDPQTRDKEKRELKKRKILRTLRFCLRRNVVCITTVFDNWLHYDHRKQYLFVVWISKFDWGFMKFWLNWH